MGWLRKRFLVLDRAPCRDDGWGMALRMNLYSAAVITDFEQCF
jgi:hypothetical protein